MDAESMHPSRDQYPTLLDRYFEEADLLTRYAEIVSGYSGMPVSRRDIYDALFLIYGAVYDMDHYIEVWEIIEDETEILDQLKRYPWHDNPVTIELPADLIPVRFRVQFRILVKNDNRQWVLHKNDRDPFPHLVHAHDYIDNVKLDLRDGKLYRKRREIDQIRKKELIEIRNKFRAKIKEEPNPITLPDMTI